MHQRLKTTNLLGHIEETKPNGLLKTFKSFLQSTPARHN